MSELNEFDIISKVEVKRLLQEFEEQNMNLIEDEEVESNHHHLNDEVKSF